MWLWRIEWETPEKSFSTLKKWHFWVLIDKHNQANE